MKVKTYRAELIFVIEDSWFTDKEKDDIEEIYDLICSELTPYDVRCEGEYQSGLYTIAANIKRII